MQVVCASSLLESIERRTELQMRAIAALKAGVRSADGRHRDSFANFALRFEVDELCALNFLASPCG